MTQACKGSKVTKSTQAVTVERLLDVRKLLVQRLARDAGVQEFKYMETQEQLEICYRISRLLKIYEVTVTTEEVFDVLNAD